MAGFAKSALTLRISGDSLAPEEVSAALGVEPTSSYRKGLVYFIREGREFSRNTGLWRLAVEDRQPEDVDAQVAELLARLTPDLAVWRTLSRKYEINLSCGLFMHAANEGFGLGARTLALLAERGIEIGFDIYAPTLETEAIASS